MGHGGDSAIDHFLRASRAREYAANTEVIRAGDSPDAVYLLVRGSVEVTMRGDRGQELLLARLGPGEFFGEMGLLLGFPVRGADVRTRTESRVAALAYSRFRTLSAECPALMGELARQLAARLSRANRWRLDLGHMQAGVLSGGKRGARRGKVPPGG